MPLPAHASVVVIGGGVMGCSTLYHLAGLGAADAVLLERHQLTSGTTWHSAAQVRALRSSRNLTDLIRYSIDLYQNLQRETGQSCGWIQRGSLSIATCDERLTHIKRQQALAQLFGVTATPLTAAEAKERWPLMRADDILGAVWSPDDGRVSPSDLCAALAKGARARGAKIFEDTAVTAICTKNNAVTALETTRGMIRCDAIAICAGLWSRETAALAGADAPLWPCEHFYLLTKTIDGIDEHLPTLSDHDGRLYLRDESGGLLAGCFEPHAKPIAPHNAGAPFQLLPEDWTHFEPMAENALHRVPCLAETEVKMLLNGAESFTADGAFLLGESPETGGLFLGCGMNSVGVASGGGAGMALAHCIVRGHPPADLHEVSPARFPPCMNSAAALAARAPEVLGEHYAIAHPGKQWRSARNLRTTPLHCEWQKAGAHFTQIYGCERALYFGKTAEPELRFARPDWFAQVGEEVHAAQRHAAVFDLSPLGKIRVRGSGAEDFLQRVCANQMRRRPGRVLYTPMLNARGGFESDVTALRIAGDEYLLCTGAAAIRRDLAWLRRNLAREKVRIEDVTEKYATLALCGEQSRAVAKRAGATGFEQIAYFHHAECAIAGVTVRAARLSYVGEFGWEITCAAGDAEKVYAALRDAGARPAGLFAQTSMRIEKRFLAYAHDIDSDTNPLQAGLDSALHWREHFTGRAALQKLRGTPQPRIVCIALQDATANPLGDEPVLCNGNIIGQTTSAAYGYRTQTALAIARVTADAGHAVDIDIAGKLWRGRVLPGAAYDPGGSRMKGG